MSDERALNEFDLAADLCEEKGFVEQAAALRMLAKWTHLKLVEIERAIITMTPDRYPQADFRPLISWENSTCNIRDELRKATEMVREGSFYRPERDSMAIDPDSRRSMIEQTHDRLLASRPHPNAKISAFKRLPDGTLQPCQDFEEGVSFIGWR